MLKSFHDAWYAPNNAILVVVGDVDPAATLAKIKALFGAITAKKLPPRPKVELGAGASQSTSPRRPTGRPARCWSRCAMPGLDSRDFPALEVLSDVLSNHRFDLYGLVPKGEAIERRLLARSAAARGHRLCAMCSFRRAAIAKALAAKSRPSWPMSRRTAFRRNSSTAAKIEERRDRRVPEEFHRRSGRRVVGRGRALRPSVARGRSGAHREGDGRRRQSRRAQISRPRQCLDRDPDARGLGQAPSHRPAVTADRRTSRSAKRSRRALPDWAERALEPARSAALDAQSGRQHAAERHHADRAARERQRHGDRVSAISATAPKPRRRRERRASPTCWSSSFSYGTRNARPRRLRAGARRDRRAGAARAPDFSVQVAGGAISTAASELLADNELHPRLPAAGVRDCARARRTGCGGGAQEPRASHRCAAAPGAVPKGRSRARARQRRKPCVR